MKLNDKQKHFLWNSISMEDFFTPELFAKEWELKLVNDDLYFPYALVVDKIELDRISKNLFNNVKKA